MAESPSIPNGTYQHQALPLAAATAACLWLYQQSGATDLVRELTDLTRLSTDQLLRWGAVRSDAALAELLFEHSDHYFAVLTIGHEVLTGALAPLFRQTLIDRTTDVVQADEYLTIAHQAIGTLIDAIAPGLETAGLEPRLDQLRVQGAFVRLYG